MRKTTIAVIGAGAATPQELDIAEKVGRQIALAPAVLVCGGLGGVMEAACRGAKSENGFTIGFLPGDSPETSNPYLDVALPTGLGEARNLLVAKTCDGVIAIGGSLGTLSELAFALKKRLPVAALSSWILEPERLPADAIYHAAESAIDAVEFVMLRIRHSRTLDGQDS